MAVINGTSVGGMTLQADYSYTQNTSANTSTVTVTLKLVDHYALYATALTGSYISVGGSKTNYTKSISYGGSTTTTTTLATKTATITHKSDGTATCNISGAFVINGTYRGYPVGTMTVNQTITLPKIARSSSFTVSSSVNTGSAISGTVTPSSTAFNHKIQLKIGSTVKDTITMAVGTTAFSYTIPHSWRPSSTRGTITAVLQTYNGTTLVASTSKNITANVSASIVPSVSALTATLVDGKGGHYVQNKSKVKLTATATAGSGASIKSYVFSGSNISASGTANNATSSVLQYSGARTYTVTVTDTRGRTATKNVSITVQPYVAPAISSMSVQRCTSNGTIDENGTYAYVTVNSTYSPIGGANTRTVVLTNSANSTATTILATTNTNGTWSGVYGSGFAVGTTYTITATIKDTAYSSTATKSGTLKAAARPMNIKSNGKGIGFGKMAETDNLLDVQWSERVRQNLTVNGTLVIDSTTTIGGTTNMNNNAMIKGHVYMGGNKAATGENHIKFSNPDASTYPHNVYIYGGNPNSDVAIGLYDAGKSRQVLAYKDGSNAISIGNGSATINLNGSALKDFVVEQGTSGAWTYRKWNNGTSECWGTLNGTLGPYTTVNGFAAYEGGVNFPSGLFTTVPNVQFQPYIGNGFAIPARGVISTATQCKWVALSNVNAANTTVKVDVFAIGKWK